MEDKTIMILDLKDGEYTVSIELGGGSGRASVTSPTTLIVEKGQAEAVIEWSSGNYDYMRVDGEQYFPVNSTGNSVFRIPVEQLDVPIPVTADTTAMSVPHEIEYTLTFDSTSLVQEKSGKLGFYIGGALILALFGILMYMRRKKKGNAGKSGKAGKVAKASNVPEAGNAAKASKTTETGNTAKAIEAGNTIKAENASKASKAAKAAKAAKGAAMGMLLTMLFLSGCSGAATGNKTTAGAAATGKEKGTVGAASVNETESGKATSEDKRPLGLTDAEKEKLPKALGDMERLQLEYAKEFSIDRFENGCKLISVSDGRRLFLVPTEEAGQPEPQSTGQPETGSTGQPETESVGQPEPQSIGQSENQPQSQPETGSAGQPELEALSEALPDDVTVLTVPVKNIYLAASAAMDMMRELDALDDIRLSATNEDGWYIDEAKDAMRAGKILYAGKYSTPDYERILSEHCELAIENTMIGHTPEVREKLESVGIPVVVDYSSHETDPLGRMEWILFYGALTGKDEKAKEAFEAQKAAMEFAGSGEKTGKTVAFFYIMTNGAVNVRKPSDYIPRLIEQAGGTYIFGVSEDSNKSSSMSMQMEEFYAAAKDADYLIYNSAVGGTIETVEELLEKSGLLSDFKAVKAGNVWCTAENLYQKSMALGDFASDIHVMLTEENPDPAETKYLYRLK